MTRYLWTALITIAVLWPVSVLSEHLKGTTAHMTSRAPLSPDGIRQHTTEPSANFKVEVWNQKTGKYTLWDLKINTEGGCHMVPHDDGAVQQGT